MSDRFDECPNTDCDNKDTDVLGLKDPVYKCDNCGGYFCPKCRNSDCNCPHCGDEDHEIVGYIN